MKRDSFLIYRSTFEVLELMDADHFKEAVCNLLRYEKGWSSYREPKRKEKNNR